MNTKSSPQPPKDGSDKTHGSPFREQDGLKRLRKSFRCAFRGVRELFLHTPNARIHLIATIAVIGAGLYFGVSRMEWCVLVICILLVLSLEAINSALEALADQVTTNYAPLIRDAKDLAAGAVLIAAVGSAIIGLAIFIPYIL